MQRHSLRNELWCVLRGRGDLEGDKMISDVRGGEWFEIPVNSWHRFCAHKNTGVLEIQYGVKCEESDIERV